MAKIEINDVELNGSELFNDSETFLNELQDSETQNVVGGLTKLPPLEKPYKTTVYIPKEPIHPKERYFPHFPEKPSYPKKPIHPKYKEIPFEPVIL